MKELICKYCGVEKSNSHHCSGRMAYEKGRSDLLKEISLSEDKTDGTPR